MPGAKTIDLVDLVVRSLSRSFVEAAAYSSLLSSSASGPDSEITDGLFISSTASIVCVSISVMMGLALVGLPSASGCSSLKGPTFLW